MAARRREIGIRIALGARPVGVRAMVLGQGLRLAVLGMLGKVALSSVMASFVHMHDAFHDRVTPSVRTLLEWAVRDHDRTALFGAQLHIKTGG